MQPRQRSAEPTPPVPSPRSAADRSGAGGDRNADKGGDFDVVEFADEVVQVRRREVKPTSSGPGSSGGGRPAVGAATRTARVEHGVLQFSRQATSSTVATDDLRQMPAALRLLLVVLAVAIAIGLGWLAMVLAR